MSDVFIPILQNNYLKSSSSRKKDKVLPEPGEQQGISLLSLAEHTVCGGYQLPSLEHAAPSWQHLSFHTKPDRSEIRLHVVKKGFGKYSMLSARNHHPWELLWQLGHVREKVALQKGRRLGNRVLNLCTNFISLCWKL